LGDIQATIDYLKDQPQVKQDAFGCIGFCFGGHIAYLAATCPISNYGFVLWCWHCHRDARRRFSHNYDTHKKSRHLYAFFGMEDASIPAGRPD